MWGKFYSDYKWHIRVCVAIMFLLSGVMFGNGAFAFATVETSEAVTALGGSFATAFYPLAQTYLGAVDMASTLAVMSLFSIIIDLIPEGALAGTVFEPLQLQSFGFFENTYIRIFIFIWFIISKLSRSNRVTYNVGVHLENIESKMGAIVQIFIVLIQISNMFAPEMTAQAAGAYGEISRNVAVGINMFAAFFIMLMALVIYIFIRALFFCMDIILIPISSVIPFVGMAVETGKVIFVIVMGLIAVFAPYLFVVISFVTLLTAILLFHKIYRAIRYYNNIYLKLRRKKWIVADDEKIIDRRCVRKLGKCISVEAAKVLIPAYIIKPIKEYSFLHKYDRWYLYAAQDYIGLIRKKLMKKEYNSVDLRFESGDIVFVKKSFRFMEIFVCEKTDIQQTGNMHKLRKKFHIVLGREYNDYFDRIKQETGFADYTEYVNQQKQVQKQNAAKKPVIQKEKMKGLWEQNFVNRKGERIHEKE